MRKLNLDLLRNGLSGIREAAGTFFVEAAIVCLQKNGHKSGVEIEITGDYSEVFQLFWSLPNDDFLAETWADTRESVEYGATAIALLLLLQLTDFQHFQRLEQEGTGDYLIKKRKESKKSSYLEISGILKGSLKNSINVRVIAKNRQILRKSTTKIDLFIIVTEFGKPKVKIKRDEFSRNSS